MPDLYVGALAALATAVCWTLSALVWTAAGKRIGALAVSFIRVILVCLVLAGYGRVARGRWLPTDVDWNTWLVLGLSGFCWFFLSDLSLFKSFLLIGTRLSLMIMSLTPPMAAILSWAWIGDALALPHWMAMGITLAGVMWVIAEQPSGDHAPEISQHRGRGIALACFAAAMQAVAFVFSKKGVENCEPMAATTICMLGALSGYVVLATVCRRWRGVLVAVRQGPVMAILGIGVLIGPLAGVAFNMVALRHAPTGVVSTIIATMPVLILPFSITMHHEKISLRTVVGAVVAVVGVGLLMR
jgi:drug/metabolite transporter (DMT)-like permease